MTNVKCNSDMIIDSWYEKAIVRYTSRIKIPSYSDQDFLYPLARCILCDHPLVVAKGHKVLSYILNQAAYQFLYGVGLLETKFVIRCCLDILHEQQSWVSDLDQLQALTVIIDEAFHAHVAHDYILQMKKLSGIEPLEVPQSNRKIDAFNRACAGLPVTLQSDFQLLAVCLAENVLTEEIANIGREQGLAQTFTTVMQEHVRDEGRHSKYFTQIMKLRWTQLPSATKDLFSSLLPNYLDDFLGIDCDRPFEKLVLRACGFTAVEIAKIIDDTQADFVSMQNESTMKTKARLLQLLKIIGLTNIQCESANV